MKIKSDKNIMKQSMEICKKILPPALGNFMNWNKKN